MLWSTVIGWSAGIHRHGAARALPSSFQTPLQGVGGAGGGEGGTGLPVSSQSFVLFPRNGGNDDSCSMAFVMDALSLGSPLWGGPGISFAWEHGGHLCPLEEVVGSLWWAPPPWLLLFCSLGGISPS